MRQPNVPKDWKIALSLLISLSSAAAAILLFAWLTDQMLEKETASLDEYLRLAIHAHATPSLTALMTWITNLGSTLSLSIVSVFVFAALWRKRRRDEAVQLAIAMIGALVLETTLKMALHRPRPDPFFGLAIPSSFSFPSGHALAALCFFAVIAELISNRTHSRDARIMVWTGAVVVVALIGFSRVYLGVHYPSDVAAGYLAGFAWVTGIHIVEARVRRRR